jgi:spore maturation protein SpmA
MLNKLWISFFYTAFVSCLVQWLVFDNSSIFATVVNSIFDISKVAVTLAIGLIGLLSFWLGLMKLAEKAGLIAIIARFISPLFQQLMPEVPKGHPALGAITMNLAANFLGLDNAATPLGIKAMEELQTLNPKRDTATNAQILFLVLNTSSITLFPIAVFMYRAQQGAANPTDVFIPILLATSASTVCGLFAVAWIQKLNIFHRVVLWYFLGLFSLLAAIVLYFMQLSADLLAQQSSLLGNGLILTTIVMFIVVAQAKSINVYDTFIDGAKQGFHTSISLIPYLLAMLVAIAVLRSSGALSFLIDSIRWFVIAVGIDSRFVDALPTALMKPLSGSGARAMMIETMNTYGADSFAGRLSAIIQGSTETTLYVLAVYFGSVGIRYGRHAIVCGLLADFAGISAAIIICYWFFG